MTANAPAHDAAAIAEIARDAYEDWARKACGVFDIPHISEAFTAGYLAALAKKPVEHRDDQRGWQIDYSPPPIPCRDFDYVATHPDFDGAPDANDSRQVFSRTINGVVAEIDGWYEDNEA